MKQIKLTPTSETTDQQVRKFADWLLRRRAENKLPFNVVVVDTEANEQYGVLIHCYSRGERDATIAALKELQQGTYPAQNLQHHAWALDERGRRIPDGVGIFELQQHQTIGKVFE